MSPDRPAVTGPVGFIGTGVMGSVMVSRLLASGRSVVVHNRSRAAAAPAIAAGARWAAGPAEVAMRCEIVLSCLRDTEAVRAVHGDVVGTLRSGQILVEHGTFDPQLSLELAATASTRGAAFLDAPVTGGTEGARSGTLAVMIGGPPEAVERAAAVVAPYARSVTRIGDAGAGLHLKLVNQLLVGTHIAVAGEAVALLQRLGLDLVVCGSVLGQGWAASAMLARTLDLVDRGRLEGTGARIDGMIEVQTLVAGLVAAQRSSAPVFAAGREVFRAAGARGMGDSDPAALARGPVTTGSPR